MPAKKNAGIDAKVIERAKAAAASGESKELSFPDDPLEGVSGFLIRVKGRKADWYVRAKIDGENRKISIADLSTFNEKDIPELRQLAIRIKAGWKTGKTNDDLKVLIGEFVAMRTRSVDGASHRAAVKIDGEWTWEMLRDAYLAHLQGMGSFKHWENFKSALGAVPGSDREKDFEPIEGVPIKVIIPGDLLDVRDNVLIRGGMDPVAMIPVGLVRSAEMTVSGLRNAFLWGFSNRKRTGLESNPAVGLPPTIKRPRPNKSQLTPEQVQKMAYEKPYITLKQLYDFLYVWLPKQDYLPQAKLAVTIQGLTGQRIESITSSFWTQYRRVHGRDAQYMWASGPDKRNGFRVIPLPDFASWCVHEALKLRQAMNIKSRRSKTDLTKNIFLFPQTKIRTLGGEATNHLTNNVINQIFHDARAKGGPLQVPEDAPKGTVFASHDLRRAFVTHMSLCGRELGLDSDSPDDAEKLLRLITHKNEGKTSIIAIHYNFSNQERLKLRILRMWESMILGAYGEHRRPDSEVFELDENEMAGMSPEAYKRIVAEQYEDEEQALQRRYG